MYCNQTLNLLSLLHVPPSHKKIYIPPSLVHLIYTAGDKCMHQNACFYMGVLKSQEDPLYCSLILPNESSFKVSSLMLNILKIHAGSI